MIVVIGIPAWQPTATGGAAAGLPVEVARALAADGCRVELIGKAGEDGAGDAVLLDLARAGVGHVAMLRDPAHPTRILPEPPPVASDGRLQAELAELLEAEEVPIETDRAPSNGSAAAGAPAAEGPALESADLELGLRYLDDYRVIVAADALDDRSARTVAEAAGYAGAPLIALLPAGARVPAGLSEATVLEAPSADPEGEFARLVGAYAAALDRGEPADRAFREATVGRGWEPVE